MMIGYARDKGLKLSPKVHKEEDRWGAVQMRGHVAGRWRVVGL
jgi:hypothetical protein